MTLYAHIQWLSKGKCQVFKSQFVIKYFLADFYIMATRNKPSKNVLCPNVKAQIGEAATKKVPLEKEEECNRADVCSLISAPELNDKTKRGQHLIRSAKQNCKHLGNVLSQVSGGQVETGLEESESADLTLENTRLYQEVNKLQFEIEAMKNSFSKISVISEGKCVTLEKEVEKLKAENAALQTTLTNLEKTSTQQLVALTAAVNEYSETNKKQTLDLSVLREEREYLRCQLEESLNTIDQHKKLVKKLKIEQSREIELHKQDIQELNTLKIQNTLLKEKLERFEVLVQSYKTQFKQVNMRWQQQQIFIRRFEEDLQSCVPVMTKSKELKQKFIDLKSRYLDDPRAVHCSERPEEEYRAKIALLERKLESLMRTGKNNANMKRRIEEKLSVTLSTFQKRESQYTELLCMERKKSKEMEKELKEKNLQLHSLMSTLKTDGQSVSGNFIAVVTLDDEPNEMDIPGHSDKHAAASITPRRSSRATQSVLSLTDT